MKTGDHVRYYPAGSHNKGKVHLVTVSSGKYLYAACHGGMWDKFPPGDASRFHPTTDLVDCLKCLRKMGGHG